MARPDPYVRPFGDTAPWNIQVAGTGATYPPGALTYPNGYIDPGPSFDSVVQKNYNCYDKTLGFPQNGQNCRYEYPYGIYARRLWDYSPSSPGYFALSAWDYTYPVYYVSDATDTYTISGGYCGSQNGHINGTTVPWNPSWAASPGTDGQMILLDDSTGKEWDLWRVSVNTTNKIVTVSGGSIVGTKTNCGISGNTTGNYKTKIDGWAPSRGVGIPYLAMLVRPEEILAGEIAHALSMPVRNPSMEFYLPPATKLERYAGSPGGTCDTPGETWPSCVPPNYAIPEGMRFYLKYGQLSTSTAFGAQYYAPWAVGGPFTNEADEVEAFITYYHNSKTTAQKNFIRTIALALYRYGWFITDHSGAAHFQLEAAASADTFGGANLWSSMGINASHTASNCSTCTERHFLDHLAVPPAYISGDNIYDGGNIMVCNVPGIYWLADKVALGGDDGSLVNDWQPWYLPEGFGM